MFLTCRAGVAWGKNEIPFCLSQHSSPAIPTPWSRICLWCAHYNEMGWLEDSIKCYFFFLNYEPQVNSNNCQSKDDYCVCPWPPTMYLGFSNVQMIYLHDRWKGMTMRKQLEGFTCILTVVYFISFHKHFLDILQLLLSTNVDKFFDSSSPFHSFSVLHNLDGIAKDESHLVAGVYWLTAQFHVFSPRYTHELYSRTAFSNCNVLKRFGFLGSVNIRVWLSICVMQTTSWSLFKMTLWQNFNQAFQ